MASSSTMFGMDNMVKLEEGMPAFLVGATIKQAKYNTRRQGHAHEKIPAIVAKKLLLNNQLLPCLHRAFCTTRWVN